LALTPKEYYIQKLNLFSFEAIFVAMGNFVSGQKSEREGKINVGITTYILRYIVPD
jgi:hypothetical protein